MIVVEKLSVCSLVQMLPEVFRHRLKTRETVRIYYFTATRYGRVFAAALKKCCLAVGEEMDYAFENVLDRSGSHPVFLIDDIDVSAICQAMRSAVFEEHPALAFLQRHFDRSRLLLFLDKCLASNSRNMLFAIYVVSWFQRMRDGSREASVIFFMPRTPYGQWIEDFARNKGVWIKWYGKLPALHIRTWGRILISRVKRGVRALRSRLRGPKEQVSRDLPVVAVPYTGKGLSLDLSKNSDLFWVPFVGLPTSQLLVCFTYGPPFDIGSLPSLGQTPVQGVSVGEGQTARSQVQPWWGRVKFGMLFSEIARSVRLAIRVLLAGWPRSKIDIWVRVRMMEFLWYYTFWRCFFVSWNIKIYLDFQIAMPWRVALDQALADLGGISMSYQRSEEWVPSPFRARSADVHFSFSGMHKDIELIGATSMISQLVVTGYIHSHAFKRVRSRALQLRTRLQEGGARFIVCFFDGYSSSNRQLWVSHQHRAEDYRFLLHQVLTDTSLGLVLKPKKPADLRERLGGVASLLDEALGTGRCLILDDGNIHAAEILPSEASLVADVTISLLSGPTPSIESILNGVPAIIIDRDHNTGHALYHDTNEGRAIYLDWKDLWRDILFYRDDRATVSWSGMVSQNLDRLDPFQDERAAERIGSYVQWLAEGLARGCSREETLGEAKQQYTAKWGTDKVVELKWRT